MDNREPNENLTPRQIERREMAARRRARERRNYIILISLLVVFAISITVCIVLLVKGGKDPAETEPSTTSGSQIVVPENVTEPDITEAVPSTPEAPTEPSAEVPTEEATQAPTEEATEAPTEEATEETTIPPAAIETGEPDREPDYADQMFFADSDSRYLEYADYADLSHWELVLARNEIFARHGRRFQNEDIQAYFNSRDWYDGRYDPDEFDYDVLNDFEVQNVRTLQAASGD